MAEIALNQSHELYEGEGLDNNHINSTLLEEETTIHSQSELFDDRSQIEYPEEEIKNNSNDKEILHVDVAFDRNLENREIKTRKHNSSIKGFLIEREKETLTFHCFGDKRVQLTRDELQFFLKRKFGEQGGQGILGKAVVEQVIRKLCMNEFGFEPCLIKIDSFNLAGLEVDVEGRREIPAGDLPLECLYKFEFLVVSRVRRVVELSRYYKELQERSKDVEILEIISPDQRDLVQVIERGRTYGELKQKLLSYYFQMVGKIILVSYHNFKILENKRKIGDVADRIVEIYQEKAWEYQDNIFRKRNNAVAGLTDYQCLIAAEEHSPTSTEQLLVNDSLIRGSLFLQVRKNQLVERYHGGLVGYLASDRIVCRSLMTLTAVKIVETCLYLEFKYKLSTEVVVYEFCSLAFLTELLKAVLAVVRIYNHRVEILE